MKKISIIIFITTIITSLVCCNSIRLTYSDYPSSLLEEVVELNFYVIEHELVILPVIINHKKEEICINSGSFHQLNGSHNNIPEYSSVILLINGLKGEYIKNAEIFSEYVVDRAYYNSIFESSDLEEVLKQSIDTSYVGNTGNQGKLKFSIKDMKYIGALIKYLTTHQFEVSEGSYIGGYDVRDLTRLGRLGDLHNSRNEGDQVK